MDSRGRRFVNLWQPVATCGGVMTRAAASIRRLEYSNPARFGGLDAWMPGCLDAGRIGLDRK